LSDEAIKKVLTEHRIIAVVGLSRDPGKTSYGVAEYLKKHGFKIIPINPFVNEILGEKAYKSLLGMPSDVQKTVEVVQIFRPSEDVPPIVDQAIQMRKTNGVPSVVWMQLGIVNEHVGELAREAGLIVVMDHCMMQEYKRLFGNAAGRN
jgi:predicted CoA-binding protein